MEVHEHQPTSSILQTALKSALPCSISLVYRTQHPNQSEHARILSTISPSASSVPQCWAAAYIDRSTRPGTELWIFAPGESPNHLNIAASRFCSQCRLAVLSLLDYMSEIPAPPLHPDEHASLELAKQHERDHPESGPGIVYESDPGTYMRHLLWPGVVLLGACHHAILQICREAGIVRSEFPSVDVAYNKFLFSIEDMPVVKELPKELKWGEMREQDLPVVQARTSIPRATRTLMSLKSKGVFEKATDQAVAWTFLGLDGSLTTLHTEPEWRGKGIAKAVAASIVREWAPGLAVDDKGTAWSHADVYVENAQSENVCRSLGGKAMSEHYWVRIDLSKAGALARGTSQQ